jgi:hypothetical protein
MPSNAPFDPTGSVSGALRAAFDAKGPTVLRQTSMLRSALAGVAAQSPRESGVLLLAADGGVADLLTQQINQQGVDSASAIRLTAGLLGQRTSLDPDACTWAATVFARTLGLVDDGADGGGAGQAAQGWPPGGPTSAGAAAAAAGGAAGGWGGGGQAPPGAAGGWGPGGQLSAWPTSTPTGGWDPAQSAPGPAAAGTQPGVPAPIAPGGAWGHAAAPAGPSTAAWGAGPSVPGGGGWPPTGPGGTPPSNRRPAVIAAAVVVVVAIVGYFAAAAGAHLPPFSKSKSAASTSTSTATTTTTVPKSTPSGSTSSTTGSTGSTVAPQSRTVGQLMPADINQNTDCQSFTPPVTGLVGLTAAIQCTDPSLTGGTVFGLQFDSPAHYQTSVTAFNSWLGFNPSSAGTECPPASGTDGLTQWDDPGFPPTTGQNVECLMVGTAHTPALTWFYPTQDAIIDAQGKPNSSELSLTTWWTDHGDAPGAA